MLVVGDKKSGKSTLIDSLVAHRPALTSKLTELSLRTRINYVPVIQ